MRRRGLEATVVDQPRLFAYADPPYLGLSSKYYRREASYAGEVDHVALVSRLEERRLSGELCGWALSASARSLATLLPLCPAGARVCVWVKPHQPSPQTYGLHNCWEPLIVAGGRQRRPGVRDWLSALPARGGGELPGRKPIAFCAWLFQCLGMGRGDSLEDLFPGTGVITRAWDVLSSGAPDDTGRRDVGGDSRSAPANGRRREQLDDRRRSSTNDIARGPWPKYDTPAYHDRLATLHALLPGGCGCYSCNRARSSPTTRKAPTL